jgi:hypothetical protein
MPDRSPTLDSAELSRDVADLRMVLNWTWLLIFLALGIENARLLLQAGQWQKIFEEMLGDPQKLPQVTKLFLAWTNAGGGFVAPVSLGAVFVAGLLCLFVVQRLRSAALTSGVFGLALFIHATIARLAAWSPVEEVIAGFMSQP